MISKVQVLCGAALLVVVSSASYPESSTEGETNAIISHADLDAYLSTVYNHTIEINAKLTDIQQSYDNEIIDIFNSGYKKITELEDRKRRSKISACRTEDLHKKMNNLRNTSEQCRKCMNWRVENLINGSYLLENDVDKDVKYLDRLLNEARSCDLPHVYESWGSSQLCYNRYNDIAVAHAVAIRTKINNINEHGKHEQLETFIGVCLDQTGYFASVTELMRTIDKVNECIDERIPQAYYGILGA